MSPSNGVPSIGSWVTVGSGVLGAQTINAAASLPASTGGDGGSWNSGSGPATQTTSGSKPFATGGSSNSGSDSSSAGKTSLSGTAALLGGLVVLATFVL